MEVASWTIFVLISNEVPMHKKSNEIRFHRQMKTPLKYYHGVFIYYENVISLDFHGISLLIST